MQAGLYVLSKMPTDSLLNKLVPPLVIMIVIIIFTTLLSTKKSISFFEIVVKSVNSRDFSSQRI